MTNSYFDVYAEEEQDVSQYWVNKDQDIDISLIEGFGFEDAITQNIWVSPNGDDSNSGFSLVNSMVKFSKK